MKISPEPAVFGPVPSRRLGRSLGVDTIPSKSCSYACVYCQAGPTTRLTIERRTFFSPEVVARVTGERLERAAARGQRIDYVTFLGDGEPTLDLALGRAIELVRMLGVRVAVLTNGSLLWMKDVREALAPADWVSLKVDTVDEQTWRHVNRPFGRLALDQVLQGHRDFARSYAGTLATETMIIDGLNDGADALEAVAEHVGELQPAVAWLTVPVRPPAQAWVRAPAAHVIEQASKIFARRVARVGCLTTRESDEVNGSGNAAADLLATVAVHPLSDAAADRILADAGADRSVLERLLKEGRLVSEEFGGVRFYRAGRNRG